MKNNSATWRAPRVPYLETATLTVEGRAVACRTVNVSTSGMLILPRSPRRAPGTPVEIAIQLSEAGERLALRGTIVREDSYCGEYAVGVRFDGLGVAAARRLEQLVEQRLGRLRGARPGAGRSHAVARSPRPRPASPGRDRITGPMPPARRSREPDELPATPSAAELDRIYAEALRDVEVEERAERGRERKGWFGR